ncbi:hypothetical protein [Brevibacillus agri]|uniref:hypothetical protein n=1 Tax=Brevibacillus agri TaxID=51101 RepID=UPI0012FE29EB
MESTPFFLIWVITFVYACKQMFRLKREITFLSRNEKYKYEDHDKMNVVALANLSAVDTIDKYPAVLMFASTSCYPCHEALEQFIVENNKLGITFKCIISKQFDKVAYNDFFQKYQDDIQILVVDELIMNQFNVSAFPTFLLLKSKGEISQVTSSVQMIIKSLKGYNKVGKTMLDEAEIMRLK